MFICTFCQKKYTKWIGKCTCGNWNTIVEEINHPSPSPILEKINQNKETIIQCNVQEFSRVCQLRRESLVIIGGEPGIGKSTLMCHLASNIKGKCLYLAGEEAKFSVEERFKRIKQDLSKTNIINFSDIGSLEKLINKYDPDLIILDSLHTTRSSSKDGPLTQIREVIFFLGELAKKYGTCILCVSHITKDGIIAGPKMLEHMVDIVLYLEGDRYGSLRILRSIKNRFGSTSEAGVFEMMSDGLKEVLNPSALFLSSKRPLIPGSVVFAGISGARPFFVEVQALVNDSNYPQIETIGMEQKRIKMIIAILNQWCNINLSYKDVYVNIVGGVKLVDTSVDLAVAMALMSSFKKRSISGEVCFFGELGLTGEIRRANSEEVRIKEAIRLGFKKIYANSDNSSVVKVNLINNLIKML